MGSIKAWEREMRTRLRSLVDYGELYLTMGLAGFHRYPQENQWKLLKQNVPADARPVIQRQTTEGAKHRPINNNNINNLLICTF